VSRLKTITDREDRRRNIIKLRGLGYTFKEIGSIYGVSDATAYYWLRGDRKARKGQKSTPYFRKKPPDGRCEICGNLPPPKKPVLGYHCWDKEKPSVGIWVCWKCLSMTYLLDTSPELAKKYLSLKQATIRNYARLTKDREFMYG